MEWLECPTVNTGYCTPLKLKPSLDALAGIVHGLNGDALGLHVSYLSFGVTYITEFLVRVLTQHRGWTPQQGRRSRKSGGGPQGGLLGPKPEAHGFTMRPAWLTISIVPEFGNTQVLNGAYAYSLQSLQPLGSVFLGEGSRQLSGKDRVVVRTGFSR